MTPGCKYLTLVWLAAVALFIPGLSPDAQVETGGRAERIVDKTPEIRALESAIAARPDDYTARAELARLLGRAGRYEEALSQYDGLVQAFPDDVDHSLARAYVLSWLGRDQEALRELERARVLAPDYQDVWQLEIRVLERQKDVASKTTAEALRLEAENHFPDSEWRRSIEVAEEIHWKMTLGAGYEDLSGDNPDWNNQFLQLDWMRSGNQRYFGRVARDVRFDHADRQFVAGGEWRLPRDWTVGGEVNASPDANFQPETGFAFYLERPFAKDWVGDLAIQQRRYSDATVSTYGAALQRYFGNYRLAYGLKLSHLHGYENSLAQSLAMDWYVTPQTSVRITLSGGDEAEAVGAGQVLETSVRSATLSGRHAFSERLTLSWSAGTHLQGDLYRRNYVGLALTVGL